MQWSNKLLQTFPSGWVKLPVLAEGEQGEYLTDSWLVLCEYLGIRQVKLSTFSSLQLIYVSMHVDVYLKRTEV